MRIPSGKTDQLIFFVAVDSTDLKTRETGLTTFTVYRSRKGGTATVYTTPTVAELSSSNMPGVYSLLIDEDTTIDSGSDSEEYCVHITQASMAPVTRTIELYRRDTTSGQTIDVASGGVEVNSFQTGAITAGAFAAGAIDAAAIAANAIGSSELADGAITSAKFAAGAITATVIADAAIDAATFAAGAIDAAAIATDALGALELAAGAATEIASAVWDMDATAHQTQGTFGQAIGDPVADTNTIFKAVVTDATGATIGADIITIDDFLDTEVAAILAAVDTEIASIKTVTDQMVFTTANRLNVQVFGIQADAITASAIATDALGSLELAATAATEIADAVWATAARTLTALDEDNTTLDLDATIRAAVGLASANLDTQLTTIDDFLDTEVAAIKAKTDNLPTDPADASDIAASFATVNTKLDTIDDFLDTEVAAIKAKTDNLPSDPADQSLIIAATDAIVTLVNDLPTNAELATALDPLPTANENADALLDRANAIETGYTVRATMALIGAALVGKVSGFPTDPVFRSMDDSEDRIAATVAAGNRTSVTLTP